MNTKELLEMASLDALGLLDEDERRAFERAFREASASLRGQIRREQARLACDETLLPRVEPPASLRERVLGAVRDAMRAVAGPAERAAVAGRINSAAWSWRGRVSPVWRAACIGFATATVVLLTAGFQLQREWNGALTASANAAMADMIREQLGSRFANVLLSPSSRKVAMRAVADNMKGEATLLIDPESRTAFLVARNLPVFEGRYRLVALDDRGAMGSTLTDFAASAGGLVGMPVRLDAAPISASFAIVRASAMGEVGKPVLVSG